eukprot:gene10497-12262_t
MKLIEKDQKIVVFDGPWLDDRFNELPGSHSVYTATVTIESDYKLDELTNFDTPRGSFEQCKWSQKTGDSVGDIHGWFDVFFYSTRKFTAREDLTQFDENEWLRLQKTAREDLDDDDLFGGKYVKLRDAARLNRIYKNPEYLAQVQEREATATSVPLTATEQSVLDCVRDAPQLQGIIEHEGFEMYTERY